MKLVISTRALIYCALSGMAILILGFILGFRIFPSIVQAKIWENSILRENTSTWDVFMKIPFPFQIKVSFFNVQNPEDILQGAKPIVKEIGPYVYKVSRWKDEVEWNSEEISFYDYMKFEFDPKASGKLSDEDTVTILNAPYNALILTVEEMSPEALATVNEVLPTVFGDSGIFTTAKVKDILFDGTTICDNFGEPDFAARMICTQMKAKAKAAKAMSINNNSISYSYLRFKNNTHLGRFTINSGLKVKEDVWKLLKYDNASQISVWNAEPAGCNRVRGLTAFPPYVTENMTFEVFGEDICRSLQLRFSNVETVKGIEGLRFAVPNDSFAAPQVGLENYCYCINKTRTLEGDFGCLNDGLMDLTTCLGAPVLLSFPHLLYGHSEYTSTVEGLRPNESLHQTFVVLEPHAGIPLKMAKRVQFNMFLRAVEDITSIENVTNSLIPILWIEESMTLNDDFIQMVKQKLLNNLKILEIIKWGLLGLGTVTTIIPTALIIYSN